MRTNDSKLPPGPLPDALCRAVAAAPEIHDPEPAYLEADGPWEPVPSTRRLVSMGVAEAEREGNRRGLIELLEYAATYLSHPDVRPVVDNFALPGSALAARCREAAANLESEAVNGA